MFLTVNVIVFDDELRVRFTGGFICLTTFDLFFSLIHRNSVQLVKNDVYNLHEVVLDLDLDQVLVQFFTVRFFQV